LCEFWLSVKSIFLMLILFGSRLIWFVLCVDVLVCVDSDVVGSYKWGLVSRQVMLDGLCCSFIGVDIICSCYFC